MQRQSPLQMLSKKLVKPATPTPRNLRSCLKIYHAFTSFILHYVLCQQDPDIIDFASMSKQQYNDRLIVLRSRCMLNGVIDGLISKIT